MRLSLIHIWLYKALRLALVGTVMMAVLLAALLVVRLVKKQKKGLVALGVCLGLCVGAGAALYLSLIHSSAVNPVRYAGAEPIFIGCGDRLCICPCLLYTSRCV